MTDTNQPDLFIVRLICCGRDDGVFGPVPWEQADEFRESYCSGLGVGPGGHDRAGIIESANGSFWPIPVHRYPRTP